MSAGPKNDFVARRRRELLEQMEPPPAITFREWRRPPDCREYARRHHVWGLLEWYHEQVLFGHYFGFRNRMKRLWWKLTGQNLKLMSPWKQLVFRDMAEAELAAEREFDELDERRKPSS